MVAGFIHSAGYRAVCVDLFADRDTAFFSSDLLMTRDQPAAKGVFQAASFAGIFQTAARLTHNLPENPGCDLPLETFAVDQWLPVGGLENESTGVAQLTKRIPVCGCTPSAIARSGNWRSIRRICNETDNSLARFPETILPCDPQTENARGRMTGKWLRKPVAGSGGHAIELLSEPVVDEQSRGLRGGKPRRERPFLLQQFVPGTPVSGLFVSDGDCCKLLHVAAQFGVPSIHSGKQPFAYSGSIGPIPVPEKIHRQMSQTGERFANEFHLHGIFGIDFVIGNNGGLFLLEINPRITASAETAPYDGGQLFEMHRAAAGGSLPIEVPAADPFIRAKTIFYNGAAEVRIDQSLSDELFDNANVNSNGEHKPVTADVPLIRFADIPNPGTVVAHGAPLLTILATGRDPAGIERAVGSAVERLQRRIHRKRAKRDLLT